MANADDRVAHYPLSLTQGRTLTHFHAMYNNRRELPMLARGKQVPQARMSPAEVAARHGTADRRQRLAPPRRQQGRHPPL